MVQAGVIQALAELVGLEPQDRQVDRAVAQMMPISERPIVRADDLEVESLYIEVGHRVRILGGDGNVTKLGHRDLQLFCSFFDLGGKRLAAGPGMLGDVKEHALGAVELLFEVAGTLLLLIAVDVILGAQALQPLREFADILHQHAKMMDAAIVETLAELVGLEFEDRQVEGAVAQEHAIGKHPVRPSDLREVEGLLVELGHLLRIFRGDGDVTQLGHGNLLAMDPSSTLARPAVYPSPANLEQPGRRRTEIPLTAGENPFWRPKIAALVADNRWI